MTHKATFFLVTCPNLVLPLIVFKTLQPPNPKGDNHEVVVRRIWPGVEQVSSNNRPKISQIHLGIAVLTGSPMPGGISI